MISKRANQVMLHIFGVFVLFFTTFCVAKNSMNRKGQFFRDPQVCPPTSNGRKHNMNLKCKTNNLDKLNESYKEIIGKLDASVFSLSPSLNSVIVRNVKEISPAKYAQPDIVKSSWCVDEAIAEKLKSENMPFYVEVNFGRYINPIMIMVNSAYNSTFTTSIKIEVMRKSDSQWSTLWDVNKNTTLLHTQYDKEFPVIFCFHKKPLRIHKIRVYPTEWNGSPCLKISAFTLKTSQNHNQPDDQSAGKTVAAAAATASANSHSTVVRGNALATEAPPPHGQESDGSGESRRSGGGNTHHNGNTAVENDTAATRRGVTITADTVWICVGIVLVVLVCVLIAVLVFCCVRRHRKHVRERKYLISEQHQQNQQVVASQPIMSATAAAPTGMYGPAAVRAGAVSGIVSGAGMHSSHSPSSLNSAHSHLYIAAPPSVSFGLPNMNAQMSHSILTPSSKQHSSAAAAMATIMNGGGTLTTITTGNGGTAPNHSPNLMMNNLNAGLGGPVSLPPHSTLIGHSTLIVAPTSGTLAGGGTAGGENSIYTSISDNDYDSSSRGPLDYSASMATTTNGSTLQKLHLKMMRAECDPHTHAHAHTHTNSHTHQQQHQKGAPPMFSGVPPPLFPASATTNTAALSSAQQQDLVNTPLLMHASNKIVNNASNNNSNSSSSSNQLQHQTLAHPYHQYAHTNSHINLTTNSHSSHSNPLHDQQKQQHHQQKQQQQQQQQHQNNFYHEHPPIHHLLEQNHAAQHHPAQFAHSSQSSLIAIGGASTVGEERMAPPTSYPMMLA